MVINNGVIPVTIAGVLISEEKLYKYDVDNRGLRPIFENNTNRLQFLVEPISSLPDSFPDIKYFHAFASYLEKHFDEFAYDYREREEKLREFLQDKIIIFKPYRIGQHNNVDQNSFEIIRMPFEHTIDTKYNPVPIFRSADTNFSKEEFEKRLIQKRFLGGKMGISTDKNDVPQIIIWDDGDTFTIYGVFDSFKYTPVGGFCFEHNNTIKSLAFNERWEDSTIICSSDSVMFISTLIYKEIIEGIESEGLDLCYKLNSEQNTDAGCSSNTEAISTITDLELSKDDEEKIFLERFIKQTQYAGFVYDVKDLVNFHIAMKSSNLVILSGMSGTGKSKLISLYAKSLGLTEEQLKIIPVRPSWTDDSDILGYLDTMNMIFRPADTGLVETLIAAQNKDNLYIICFDEMNLSRVEHYFSQFLSVLEKDNVNEKRYLQLYNSELESRVYNSNQYKSKIELGDNILFVGTVNIDESTYHFSDKVLDRANVISLKICPIHRLKELSDNLENYNEKIPEKVRISFRDFNDFKQKKTYFDLSDREIEFLTELHNMIHSESKNLGVGYRIVKQIDTYLKNIPNGDFITRQECFDLQVVQRILTKIRGPEDQLQGLLGKIKDDTGEWLKGKLQLLVDNYKDVSEFKITEKVIFHKAKELKTYGYTI